MDMKKLGAAEQDYKGTILLCSNNIDESAFNDTSAHRAIMYRFMLDEGGGTALSFAHLTMIVKREDYNDILVYYNTTTR